MGNEESISEKCTELNQDPISIFDSIKDDLGVSKVSSIGILHNASKVAFNNVLKYAFL